MQYCKHSIFVFRHFVLCRNGCYMLFIGYGAFQFFMVSAIFYLSINLSSHFNKYYYCSAHCIVSCKLQLMKTKVYYYVHLSNFCFFNFKKLAVGEVFFTKQLDELHIVFSQKRGRETKFKFYFISSLNSVQLFQTTTKKF